MLKGKLRGSEEAEMVACVPVSDALELEIALKWTQNPNSANWGSILWAQEQFLD